MAPATVIWAYRRTGKFAFHVLTGALDTDARTRGLPVVFAGGPEAVVAAIREALGAGRRPVVGWSFYSPDFAQMAAELAAVRAQVDDARVLHVAGGVHASAEPLQVLQAGFDLAAVGEGEQLVCDLVHAWHSGADVRAVGGIASLDARGELVRNGRADRIVLDDWPPFAPSHDRFGPIEITRGCIYACRFCQTPYFAGANFRHRSLDNILEWVRWLVRHGFVDYRFLTPTSLSYGTRGPEPDLDAVEGLLARCREAIGPDRRLWFGTFPSEVRPEHVTSHALAVMKRYVSNRALILGGQSGSDRMLAESARGHDSAAIERATALCIEHGFVPHVDFLFGMPGELPEDVEATLALMDRLVALGARVHGHTFLPLPGTPFRRMPPGALAPEVRRQLRTLASRGQLYGQWEQQERTAAVLAAGRKGGR